jgi:hypothetical protein
MDRAPTRRWILFGPGGEELRIRAENWVVALGLGMARLGALDAVGRLVCRRIDEHVIADDVSAQRRYRLYSVDNGPQTVAA